MTRSPEVQAATPLSDVDLCIQWFIHDPQNTHGKVLAREVINLREKIERLEKEVEELQKSMQELETFMRAIGSMPGREWLLCQVAIAEQLSGGGLHRDYVMNKYEKMFEELFNNQGKEGD